VFSNKVYFVFFSTLLLLPLASNSEAVPWDLLIQANVENTPLMSGDRPIVSGIVLDHASKPVPKATVNVRSGSMSIFTTTSQNGEFLAELGKSERMPGSYVVNIAATSQEGKTGIASIQFQIKGELTQTTVNQVKLSTPETQKYLASNPDDFDNDPIGFMLYNYYQKIYQEYLEEEKIEIELSQEQVFLEEQKEEANELRLAAIEEYNPSFGIFSGPEYENYVNSLDEAVKDTVVKHLNFTKNLFLEANVLKNKILENGGTAEEAQTAYLSKLSTSREMIENLDSISETNSTSNTVEPSSVAILNNTGFIQSDETFQSNNNDESSQNLVSKLPIVVNVDGINVEVEYLKSVFSVNVNGTILEFFVNGTELTLIENTD